MTGVEVHDGASSGHALSFDLREILEALGPRVLALSWECGGVECVGDGAARLERLAGEGAVVDGRALVDVARTVSQVIDGEFIGRASPAGPQEIVIKAIDSRFWEVFGNPDDLAAIRRRFADVRPAQYDVDAGDG